MHPLPIILVPGIKIIFLGTNTPMKVNWTVYPGILEPDLNVSPIVSPGGVFVMADIKTKRENVSRDLIDIDFKRNPWGADIGNEKNVVDHWEGGRIWMFKILNDSIIRGLKAPNDINDLELIDVFSNRLANSNRSYRRKAEIWQGNPVLEASQEDDKEGGWLEWEIKTRDNFPNRNRDLVPSDIGRHFFIPPTHYMSTVNSLVYKVSEGYSLNEQIKGVTTGTTVSNLLTNLIKTNEKQILTVTSSANGTELSMDELLSLNDILTVLSADSINTTKYVLEVSEQGLSSDAVLISDVYDIKLDAEPKGANDEHNAGSGIISGFDYGTTLRTIVENVTVPEGASMTIVNADGAYVPLKMLNFDTIYVNVTVNSKIYFDVLAEDGLTRILYHLQPNVLTSDAFVTSDIYSVYQGDLLIELVPRGTNVQSFLSNLIPAFGASLGMVDKWGNIKLNGVVADDDKLVVTSADETVTRVYHISKLASQYVPVTTYLAYILSNVYGIDQVDYSISGATNTTQVSDFYSKIRPVMGAIAVIVDADGNEKTSGDLAQGDKVKVTSGDGKIEVMYALHLTVVSAKLPQTAQIEIYPNPTTGNLNVSGLQPGSRIQIFNAMGVLMQGINVKESIETVSLGNYSNGIYFIIIVDNHLISGKHKIIKF
jgi:hypothetical protein